MMLTVTLLCYLLTTVYGNIEGDYCEVLDEYDNFKVSMDTFLTSRNTYDNFKVALDKFLASVDEYAKFKVSLDKFLASKDDYNNFKASLENFLASRDEYDNLKVSMDNFLASSDNTCKTKQIHKDCATIKDEFPEATDGVYRIKPEDGKPSFLAYCDMTEQEGGWLVIQRRQDGSVDFYRTWFEYMDGFGNLTGEFWLGNEKIHRLTTQKKYELRVDLEDKEGNTIFAEYSYFRVGSMSEFYKLTVDGYSSSSTAGDNLKYHNNTRFSARNLDLDGSSNINCALNRHGAWWFGACSYSHLNGLYTGSSDGGVYWNPNNYRKSTMKIRPAGDI